MGSLFISKEKCDYYSDISPLKCNSRPPCGEALFFFKEKALQLKFIFDNFNKQHKHMTR
jgi:hypothetical protein